MKGRALLSWSRAKLAVEADVGAHVIAMFEKTGRVTPPGSLAPKVERVAAIRAALEAAGVEFANGDALSVRLKARPARTGAG